MAMFEKLENETSRFFMDLQLYTAQLFVENALGKWIQFKTRKNRKNNTIQLWFIPWCISNGSLSVDYCFLFIIKSYDSGDYYKLVILHLTD